MSLLSIDPTGQDVMTLNHSTIETIMQQYAEFSGVVQVRHQRVVIFEQAYGYANRADKLANTLNTRFGTASGTKLLTGIAICQLVEQGKLTLDTRLQDIVKADFPHFDPTITIQHLLTHTSGAPDYFDEEELDAQDDFGALWLEYPTYTMKTARDFLPMFQHKPMKFKPEARFSYNNGGFILLGLVIESVSGMSYIDYVTEHVLQKANMTASGFFALDQLPAQTALGYIDNGDGTWKTNLFQIPIIGGADGGVFLTAPDVSKLWDALMSYQLLDERMTQQFLYPHAKVNPEPDDNRHYGLGIWILYKDQQVIRYTGMGADPGVSFITTYFPDEQTEITVISNTENQTWDIFGDIIKLVG